MYMYVYYIILLETIKTMSNITYLICATVPQSQSD